ncbi:hypothetical protein LJR219_000228 [Phenylobacterium sp. LjRoot219]
MTCLAVESHPCLAETGRWEAVRAAVFWGFILLVIVSPAVLGALILTAA